MSLQDRLHCPECKGRLAPAPPGELRCSACGRTVPAADGVADFLGGLALSANDPHRYGADPSIREAPIGDLLARVRGAAGNRWPGYLGEVLELGCGIGQMTEALVADEPMRGLLAIDTAVENVRECRQRLLSLGLPGDLTPAFAALSGSRNAIRDAVADTVIGVDVMARIGDPRSFLATVHRVLKPGGRAWFLVPNRRYRQALCHAVAEAVAQNFARDRTWHDETRAAIAILARSRLLLVHQDDIGILMGLDRKHLFDSELLENQATEVGFATAEMIPLSPDPFGAECSAGCLRGGGASGKFRASTRTPGCLCRPAVPRPPQPSGFIRYHAALADKGQRPRRADILGKAKNGTTNIHRRIHRRGWRERTMVRRTVGARYAGRSRGSGRRMVSRQRRRAMGAPDRG